MGECCERHDRNNRCSFDLDMVLWVLIIIVIVSCVNGNDCR